MSVLPAVKKKMWNGMTVLQVMSNKWVVQNPHPVVGTQVNVKN